CCARAASGHAPAAPLISVMNSRRLMSAPLGRGPHLTTATRRTVCCASQQKQATHLLRTKLIGLPNHNLWPPHPSSTDVSASEVGREEVCQNGPERMQQGLSTEVGYSITSLARASSDGGSAIPNAFAVFILTTRSNLVGCSTGISAGFA